MLLPGQGEQRVGMLHRLPSAGERVLAVAAEVLGRDPLDLDDADRLATTTATQLALLLSGVAWFDEAVVSGLEPTYLCGHSIGLWTAAVCAGALDLHDAIRLVRLRGEAMRAASGPDDGMLAVTGLREPVLDDLAAAVRAEGLDVWLGVVNAPDQGVVTGAAVGLGRLQHLAEQAGARRATRLDVAVAAHCPRMVPAAARLRSELATTTLARPTIALAANTSARLLRTADDLRHELWQGIAAPVRWGDTTAALHERGVDTWLQLPPGHTLAHLAEPLGDRALAVEELGLAAALVRAFRR